MPKELYFDINDEAAGGSLYRVTGGEAPYFLYEHSTYDQEKDEVKVFTTKYSDFDAFWSQLVTAKNWYFRHPLYVHPEQRAFVKEQLAKVDWSVSGNQKWQDSHRRQWTKVLSGPGNYYKGPQ